MVSGVGSQGTIQARSLSIAMAVLLLTKAIEGHDVAEWWASHDYEKVKLFISKAALGEGN